jgi:hypothetical protein
MAGGLLNRKQATMQTNYISKQLPFLTVRGCPGALSNRPTIYVIKAPLTHREINAKYNSPHK